VSINVPEGEDPAKHPDHLAGRVALFGVRKATLVDATHAGNGLTFVLEITHVIDTLHLAGALNVCQLHVRLVSLNPVPQAAQISIGRISVFRQGA
jgi:tyrosinase